MIICAIDPGPERSAWCIYDHVLARPVEADISDNNMVIHHMRNVQMHSLKIEQLVVEGMACYGMAVGASVFETVLWSGRFIEAAQLPWKLVYRKDVKMHLCGSMRAKDPNIRQALIDKFGPKGTKKNPGLLYSFKGDMFSALAVAVTYAETGL